MTRTQFDAIWVRLRPQLLHEMIGRGAMGDDAEEALGDAYVALVAALPHYQHYDTGAGADAAAAAWMRRTALNKLRDIQRRRSTRARREAPAVEMDGPDNTAQVLGEVTAQRFLESLEGVGLSRSERVAIVGVLHGVDARVIASMLGVTDNCLRQHLHNARRRVQRAIAALPVEVS